MTISKSIDIEETLRAALAAQGVAVYVRPLPKTYALPCVLIQQTGGSSVQNWAGVGLVDQFTVVVDSRAESEAEALDLLNEVIARIETTAAAQSTQIRHVEINSMASWGSDPARPDLALCTATILVTARRVITEVN